MVKAVVLVTIMLAAVPAAAQPRREPIGIRGFVHFGSITFQAEDSFDAVLDRHSGPLVGGGAQVLLPWSLYVEIGAARFAQDGERVFVGPALEVFRLGIPVAVSVTPLEVTGGWRYRNRSRVIPYGGVGYSSYRYRETSDFAAPGDNVDERFGGVHVVGGVEYQAWRWLAIGGEVVFASIPDALGERGVSAAFNERNLGGRTFRLKINLGR